MHHFATFASLSCSSATTENCHHYIIMSSIMRKPAYAKTNAQISCMVAQLISTFVFPTKIAQSLYFVIRTSKPLASVAVQHGLCRTWSETLKTVLLLTWLIYLRQYLFILLSAHLGKLLSFCFFLMKYLSLL